MIKSTDTSWKNPLLNRKINFSELNDVLQSGFFKCPLGENYVDWYVTEIVKLENRMVIFCKNTKKGNIMSEDVAQDSKRFLFH